MVVGEYTFTEDDFKIAERYIDQCAKFLKQLYPKDTDESVINLALKPKMFDKIKEHIVNRKISEITFDELDWLYYNMDILIVAHLKANSYIPLANLCHIAHIKFFYKVLKYKFDCLNVQCGTLENSLEKNVKEYIEKSAYERLKAHDYSENYYLTLHKREIDEDGFKIKAINSKSPIVEMRKTQIPPQSNNVGCLMTIIMIIIISSIIASQLFLLLLV